MWVPCSGEVRTWAKSSDQAAYGWERSREAAVPLIPSSSIDEGSLTEQQGSLVDSSPHRKTPRPGSTGVVAGAILT